VTPRLAPARRPETERSAGPGGGARPGGRAGMSTRTFRILLASEKPPISEAVLAEVVRLAREHRAKVSILQLMKIWGSGMGLPHPALKPNRQENRAAWDAVLAAEAYLEKHGIPISGKNSLGTRKPAKVIVREASRLGVDLLVMEANNSGAVRSFFFANEPRRVARRAPMPVHLVGAKV